MMRPRAAGVIVLLGVIIFFVGTILLQSTTLLERPDPPEWDDYDGDTDAYNDAYKSYEDDVEDWEDMSRSLHGIGKILNWVGAMIIVLPLYLIGIGSEKIDWKVRASMLSAATAIVIVTMIVTLFTQPIL